MLSRVIPIQSLMVIVAEYACEFTNTGFLELVDNKQKFLELWIRKCQRIDTTAGMIRYFEHGRLHRLSAPAMFLSDGSEFWWSEGKQHRNGDKPAVIRSDGARWWIKHGKIHRDGGLPAIIAPDGRKYYYINGEDIYKKDI